MKTRHIKLIFGLKLKQLRLDRGMSLSGLASKCGMSVSYINEIESGKKYPKADKIAVLAETLGTTYDKLVSLKLVKSLTPVADLLESNILEQLPLEHYGIDINKLISLMSESSPQLSALIATFIETARTSELSRNSFSRNALRVFKEFNENYFEEFEDTVICFAKENKLKNKYKLGFSELKQILENNYNYTIEDFQTSLYPGLREFRAAVIKNNHSKLLLNDLLSEEQKAFIAGKEIAYNYLGIKDRSYQYSSGRLNTFDHLINYFKASYFSTALLINATLLEEGINKIFHHTRWDEESLLSFINKFNTTTEVFFQRLASLSAKSFGLNKFFFYRINHIAGTGEYSLLNEIKLNTNRNFSGYQMGEHFCRRWVSMNLLKEYENILKKKKSFSERIAAAARIKFYDTGDEYLCITIAQKGNLVEGQVSSITIGYLIDDSLKQKIKFANDPGIADIIVGETCEGCRIDDCKERMAPPTAIRRLDKSILVENALQKLISDATSH